MGIDIEKLKGLAEAATTGPWVAGGNWVSTAKVSSVAGKGASIADCARGDQHFIAAANPAAVLELISEIDRRGERNVYWIDQANAISRDRATIRAERDQLRAENEDGLAVIRTQKEQLDCYIKDAERYRWLCAGNGYFMEESGLCGHFDEKAQADAEIDAAMTQEQP